MRAGLISPPALPFGAPPTAMVGCAPIAVTKGAVRMGILAELGDQGLNFFSNHVFHGPAISGLMGDGNRG
jgi:hypothetical protein